MVSNFKRKGTNRKKAIFEFIMAGLLIFGGIIVMMCDKIWIANASRVPVGSYANYYEDYLLPAIAGEDGGYFHIEAYPIITGVVCIITAIIKGLNGAILLYQKSFAKSFQMSQTKIEINNK